MAQMMWFSPRIVLLNVRMMSDIIREQCAPKNPQKGRKYAFSSQTSIILKLAYLGRGLNDFDKIWHSDVVQHS